MTDGLLIGMGFGASIGIFFGFIVGFLSAIFSNKFASSTSEAFYKRMNDWITPGQKPTERNGQNNKKEEEEDDSPVIHSTRENIPDD